MPKKSSKKPRTIFISQKKKIATDQPNVGTVQDSKDPSPAKQNLKHKTYNPHDMKDMFVDVKRKGKKKPKKKKEKPVNNGLYFIV